MNELMVSAGQRALRLGVAPARPKLVTFGISHFCEKARWALDWHGLPYEEIRWPLGAHRLLAKLYGARSTTLPILLDGTKVVQGSAEIVDWADQQVQDRVLTVGKARDIEKRADNVIGVHVRRLSYAEMLPQYSCLVREALFRNIPMTYRLVGKVTWPVTRRLMMQALDIRPGAAAESRAILEAELDWLDNLLADSRSHLAGQSFSRADIAVASLLAPVARPMEMPTFHSMSVPDSLVADFERWRERPIMGWVLAQYRDHRSPRTSLR
jgi:glutathione S-transferase